MKGEKSISDKISSFKDTSLSYSNKSLHIKHYWGNKEK